MGSRCIVNIAANSVLDVSYGETFGSEDIRLLEVDESIMQEVFDRGVVIRGGLNDEAVLCTSSNTYAIKFVLTSNTVLVMPPLNHTSCSSLNPDPSVLECNGHACKARAFAAAAGHLELVDTVPSIERLKGLLSQRPYKEENADTMEFDESTDGLYTWDDLLDKIQASDRELQEALQALGAVKIGKFWRIVHEDFMRSILELIVLNALQHDWSLHALNGDEVISVLSKDGYSSQIVRHCLSTFGKLASPSLSGCGMSNYQGEHVKEVWELDERLVCLYYAKRLMSAAAKWKLDDFLVAWQRRLPSGMQCSLEMLRGEALVEKLGSESWLHCFSVSSLPFNPAERFVALFRERPKWEWEDLEPYVSDLRAPGKSVEALLLKYTRKTQPTADASPVFTAR